MLACRLPVSRFGRIQAELGACLQTQPLQWLWQEFCTFKASLSKQSDPSPKEVGEVGEIAYLVKRLHEDPSSISRTHISCICSPSTKKVETGGFLGFTDQPA